MAAEDPRIEITETEKERGNTDITEEELISKETLEEEDLVSFKNNKNIYNYGKKKI